MTGRPSKVLPLVKYWLPVLAWAAFIFYLSSIPDLRFVQGPWDFWIRKAGHMGVFGILARLIARAFINTAYLSWKKIFAAALVLTFLYASLDEYHQTFTQGRHGCISDVMIDTTGGWLALGIIP
jgi:VanZ family protein